MITSRQRFLNAIDCKNTDRPPVWLMRQAGRYLPEYRALKEEYSFRTMVRTPDLATKVTLQPIQRFPGLDAAILFSDILVIPEALGVDYRFRDEGGIELESTVRTDAQVATLQAEGTADRLAYVGEALRTLRSSLGDSKALLGFCGAPWTLALYLVEGGSPGEGRNLREMLYRSPETAKLLREKVTAACAEYVEMQCQAGADAIQLFDSWAGLCPAEHYKEWCIAPLDTIRKRCDKPFIFFSRGAGSRLLDQKTVQPDALAVDWATPLAEAREIVGPAIALQGNLDPLILETEPHLVRTAVEKILADRAGDQGFILNGGHGVSPKTKIDCVEELLQTVADFATQ